MNEFNLNELQKLASSEDVSLIDLIMIAANCEGAKPFLALPRARLQIRPFGQDEIWQIILPLDNEESPFMLGNGQLALRDEPVGDLVSCENDDVVLTYLRAGGRSLTLNTHSRSTCIGCVFCPNIIEDAADGNVDGSDELLKLLRWTASDNGWPDLSGVEVITVCSGCFNTADAALTHLTDLRAAATRLGFEGRIHILSSVVRAKSDLERLSAQVAPFHLTLTLECFTRRDLILKESKASLTLDDACRILDDCADLEILGDFTYVAGLDPLEVAVAGLRRLAEHVTTFPRIQVFQGHNHYMRKYRDSSASRLTYYLELRRSVEDAFVSRGLLPKSWENYRPLWYTRIGGMEVEGPRV